MERLERHRKHSLVVELSGLQGNKVAQILAVIVPVTQIEYYNSREKHQRKI
jgi:hypothetical protein